MVRVCVEAAEEKYAAQRRIEQRLRAELLHLLHERTRLTPAAPAVPACTCPAAGKGRRADGGDDTAPDADEQDGCDGEMPDGVTEDAGARCRGTAERAADTMDDTADDAPEEDGETTASQMEASTKDRLSTGKRLVYAAFCCVLLLIMGGGIVRPFLLDFLCSLVF